MRLLRPQVAYLGPEGCRKIGRWIVLHSQASLRPPEPSCPAVPVGKDRPVLPGSVLGVIATLPFAVTRGEADQGAA